MPSGGSLTGNSVLWRSILLAILCVLVVQLAAAVGSISDSLRIVGSVSVSLRTADLTRNIPSRPFHALTGSQFATLISKLDPREREQAILDEVLRGNLPAFLRHLVPIELSSQGPQGTPLTATIFVTADYLPIGAD